MTLVEAAERIACLRDQYRREKESLRRIGCARGVSLVQRRQCQAVLRLKMAAIRGDMELLRSCPTDETYERLRFNESSLPEQDLTMLYPEQPSARQMIRR